MTACEAYPQLQTIQMPSRIRNDKDLTFFQMILFCELAAWSEKEPCPYSLRQLAKLHGVSENTVRSAVNKLEDKGYITIQRIALNGIREYHISTKKEEFTDD
jgi:DNA-binding GntR family transcriptional regulator